VTDTIFAVKRPITSLIFFLNENQINLKLVSTTVDIGEGEKIKKVTCAQFCFAIISHGSRFVGEVSVDGKIIETCPARVVRTIFDSKK